ISVPDNAATDPAIPPGYQFDFVCRDMLLNDFVAKDGALATKSGMHYQVLVLPASAKKLTLPVLKKLRAFVAGGVTVIGARPTGSPSLGDGDAQVAALIAELWDGGKISAGPLADVLAARHIEPSFTFTGADKIVALHRTLADGELFFIANQDAAPAHVQASLRASGREAELWHPDDARIERASFEQRDGRTIVPLELAPYESVFVVLRKPTRENAGSVPAVSTQVLASIDGAWDVTFTPGRGAPASAQFGTLQSWTESDSLRYFSGTG